MDPSSLVFLSTVEAMQLAAAWPFLSSGSRSSDAAWAAAAGVSLAEAKRYRQPLHKSGICRPDGKTDKLALKFIAAQMTKNMRKK